VDYMEMGYKGAKSIYPPDEFGPWKHCDEEYVRRIVGDNDTPLKLSVMADAERSDYQTDILPKSESVIDTIRVACYIHQIPVALDMIQDAYEKGYLIHLLEICSGNVSKAAKLAGKYRADFYDLLKKHHLKSEDFKKPL